MKRLLTFVIFFYSVSIFACGVNCNLYYWPNKNMGFGHVALEVADNNSGKYRYMSWAMGNAYYADEAKHLIEPEIIPLPIKSRVQSDMFFEWFERSPYGKRVFTHEGDFNREYGKEYRLLTNNCAHAVIKGMKALGLNVNSNRHFALLPKEVRKIALKLKKEEEQSSPLN